MKDQAARVCRALCRTRVVAEMHQRWGNPARRPFEAGAEHHGPGGTTAAPTGKVEVQAPASAIIASTSQM